MKDKVNIKEATLSKPKKSIHDKSLKIFFYSFIGSWVLSFSIMIFHLSLGLQVFTPLAYIVLPLIGYVLFFISWLIFIFLKNRRKEDSIIATIVIFAFVAISQTLTGYVLYDATFSIVATANKKANMMQHLALLQQQTKKPKVDKEST